jgi:hypothetical protein
VPRLHVMKRCGRRYIYALALLLSPIHVTGYYYIYMGMWLAFVRSRIQQ